MFLSLFTPVTVFKGPVGMLSNEISLLLIKKSSFYSWKLLYISATSQCFFNTYLSTRVLFLRHCGLVVFTWHALMQVGRLENVVGWYHSHPGYGCWLSGIDVSTQMLNQQFQEPFLAVVIDPTRTVSAGKVEIGAFRTYPEGYKPPDEPVSEYQTIPLNKIEDFGVHCKQVNLVSRFLLSGIQD